MKKIKIPKAHKTKHSETNKTPTASVWITSPDRERKEASSRHPCPARSEANRQFRRWPEWRFIQAGCATNDQGSRIWIERSQSPVSAQGGGAAPVSFRFPDPRSAVCPWNLSVILPGGRVTAQSRTGGSNRSICYCLSETCPTKCLVSRLNAPGASRASTPTPLPVPDTLLLGEGYDDTLNMQEGMRGNTAMGQIIWRRNLFPGRLSTAGFLALACCHANETKINIPRSAKPCVNNHTANNLNKIPCPVPK